MDVLLNCDSQVFVDDPFSAYDVLRAECPVYRHSNGDWYLSRFQDVSMALMDERFRRCLLDGEALPLETALQEKATPFHEMLKYWIVFSDPPRHTELRTGISEFFTVEKTAQLTELVERLSSQLIDDISVEKGTFDLVDKLTYPLPIQVVVYLLGLPAEDWPKFKAWCTAITRGLDQYPYEKLCQKSSKDIADEASSVTLELFAYVDDIISKRLYRDEHSLIAKIVSLNLSRQETLSLCVFFIWSGHETTKNLMGNALLALWQYPLQFKLLRDDLSLVDATVEEVLRFYSPVQKTNRWVSEDIKIGGETIPAGSQALLLIGAANRDSAQFELPGQFDILRSHKAHLAFGKGVHFCLGAMLAKLETKTMLSQIVTRLPGLHVDTETPDWQVNSVFRSLKTLRGKINDTA